MNVKKDAWKVITFCCITSLILSYVAIGLFCLVEKGGEIARILQSPLQLFSFVREAQGQLQTILYSIPFVSIGSMLYWQRKSFLQEKYEDASEYAVHGEGKFEGMKNLINGKVFSKNNQYKKAPLETFQMARGTIVGKVPKKKQVLIMEKDTEVDNANVLIIGSPGSGKGQAYVYPNLINNTEETIICSDPKGELYRDTHLIKQDQGYRVYLVDFVDFINCHRYNPLDNVKDDIDARAVANIIAKNAAEGNRDFWTKSALSFLSAIILYVKNEYKDKANMTHVIDFAVRAGREAEYFEDVIASLTEEHPAYHLFRLASLSAGSTKMGIMSTMAQQIGIFALRKVAGLTETSDFLFEDLQKHKSIVYVKIPMDENPFEQLTAMFFDQLIEVFYKIAVRSPNNKVPIRSIFLFDEFSNIGTIEKYPKVLSTCRGLDIVMMTVVQDFGQLEDKKRYGHEMTRSIINNHDTILFLRTKDKKTAEYLSGIADDTTAKVKTSSIQHGSKNTSKSVSEQYVKRRLIPVGDLIRIKKNDCYLFVSGHDPVKLEKAWQFQVFHDFMKNYETKYRPIMLEKGMISKEEAVLLEPIDEKGNSVQQQKKEKEDNPLAKDFAVFAPVLTTTAATEKEENTSESEHVEENKEENLVSTEETTDTDSPPSSKKSSKPSESKENEEREGEDEDEDIMLAYEETSDMESQQRDVESSEPKFGELPI
ncbi:hypothetical protein BM86_35305 [Bacillus thuringiensis]|uniref:Type IV secretory system conjugative DNA transfer n=1 Tax=Bacillus thuringiensis TaxID=1428 RepID=A0A9W3SK38_BACTU|nr:type IV secretory system conjugative DNA transfer family protein [Bacillus thuringiensis]ANS52315.1 type IV secretory system conjugative DNA transfer [Bacillus thuringiensis]MBH0340558.1 hypothetical protein [Bacillus thuringiensis]